MLAPSNAIKFRNLSADRLGVRTIKMLLQVYLILKPQLDIEINKYEMGISPRIDIIY